MIQGWHFTTSNTLGNGDGRPIVVGECLDWPKPLVLCESGLHLSERAIDALAYAPGTIAWRVEGDGEMIRGDGEIVCRRRRAVARVDAARLLVRFARACALDVAHLWAPPAVVRRFLLTARSARSARSAEAAWEAREEEAAAWSARAAWEAAREAWAEEAAAEAEAAWEAEEAAGAAARAAAWAAAEAAEAAGAAAREAQNDRLTAWLLRTIAGETFPDRIAVEEIAEPARATVRAWGR